MESMNKHGYMPSSPIHCRHNGGSGLQVVRGHHRLDCARRLGLSVYYIVDDSDVGIFEMEGDSRQRWTVADFASARAQAGDTQCAELLAFQADHDLTLGAAASLAGGETAGSANKSRTIRTGTFEIGDMQHAHAVVEITDLCRELAIPFATATSFVSAISRCLRVPEFDADLFCHKLRLHKGKLERRSRVDEYLDQIEALYNYASHERRIPLKHLAEEVARERKNTFGGNQAMGQERGRRTRHRKANP